MADIKGVGPSGPWMQRNDGTFIKFDVTEQMSSGATLVRCTAKKGHIVARHTVKLFGFSGLSNAGAEAEAKARHKLNQLLEPNEEAALQFLAKLGKGAIL